MGIWVGKSITAKPLNLNLYSVEREFEIAGCSCENRGRSLLIFNVYRSPLGNFNKFIASLEEILERYYDCKKKVFICGDWNVQFNKKCKEREALLELMSSYGFAVSSQRTYTGRQWHFKYN